MKLPGIIRMIEDAIAMRDDEIALEALMDHTDWSNQASVEYCLRVAEVNKVPHTVDEILDRWNAEKGRRSNFVIRETGRLEYIMEIMENDDDYRPF